MGLYSHEKSQIHVEFHWFASELLAMESLELSVPDPNSLSRTSSEHNALSKMGLIGDVHSFQKL